MGHNTMHGHGGIITSIIEGCLIPIGDSIQTGI